LGASAMRMTLTAGGFGSNRRAGAGKHVVFAVILARLRRGIAVDGGAQGSNGVGANGTQHIAWMPEEFRSRVTGRTVIERGFPGRAWKRITSAQRAFFKGRISREAARRNGRLAGSIDSKRLTRGLAQVTISRSRCNVLGGGVYKFAALQNVRPCEGVVSAKDGKRFFRRNMEMQWSTRRGLAVAL